MHHEQLLVGTVGLDVDDWQGVFYDADLPRDWRAAYYSTLLRGVMLPAREWREAVVAQWVDEVDTGFRFVLQLSADIVTLPALVAATRELAALPAGFAAQVAGIVLPVDVGRGLLDWQDALKNLQTLFPLCLDAGGHDVSGSPLAANCREADLALAWYPALSAQPEPAGNFMVAYLHDEDLPRQRAVIEQLGDWMGEERGAGLFQQAVKQAPLRAQETRQLAELLGV